jgi:CheY-like chemotaxis protein
MRRVLIVDDEATVRRVLTLCLAGAGYEVEGAPNGAVALEKIRARAPDVLITDIQMPQMTGRELCSAIHAEFPERAFPILVMTSMTARENREWASLIPNTSFLEKPLSPRNLVRHLADYADGPGPAGS